MHKTSIVADKERATLQHRRGGQEVDVADEVHTSLWRQRVDYRRSLCPLMRGGQDRHPRTSERTYRNEPLRQLGKAFGAPLLAAPIGGGSDGEHRSADRKQRGGCLLMMRGEPEPRGWRWIERKEMRKLANAMLRGISFCHHAPAARTEQIGKRGTTEVDHHVPASRRNSAIEFNPVQRTPPLSKA